MMKRQRWILSTTLALAMGAGMQAYAQQRTPDQQQSGGWRRIGDPPPQQSPAEAPAQTTAPAPPDQTQPQPPMQPYPSTLTLPAGSWITVRVDEPLSSDRNQPGDVFTASLAQPLVANGRVIARRGQTVSGVVAEAEKAGRAKGTSRLALQLTELSLVDGRQLPVNTTLMQRRGDTSVGRDAGAIGTTTATGAAIGAIADGGFGAGMGAIAGAAASTVGVLLTRGRPTVVYPETLLTFRIEEPVIVSAENAEEAFQPVTQDDYEQRGGMVRQSRPYGPPPPPPYYYGGYYGYYPPYFYGPSLLFYSGPRFFHGRGFRRW